MYHFVCCLVALAQTTPQQLVERSATAIGGLEKLRAETAVRTVEEGLEYLASVGDPRVTPMAFAETVTILRRVEPHGLRQTTVLHFPMRTAAVSQTIVASDSVVSRDGLAAASAFDAEQAQEI